MSGNENSDDENMNNNNFLLKLKELKERNLSNSPAVRKSPQRHFYTNETELIKESTNECELEENSAFAYDENQAGNNFAQQKPKPIDNRINKRKSSNNLHFNSKSNKNNESKKNFSLNKYSNNNYNTEINNRRFEIEPSENKRNIIANVNIIRNTPKINNFSKPDKNLPSKQYKSKSNNKHLIIKFKIKIRLMFFLSI